MTSANKKRAKVLVIGDSLLRSTEAPICCLDNISRKVCCLLGPCIRNIKKTIYSMIKPHNYYPFLVFQTGSHEAATRKLKNSKKIFTSLQKVLKDSEAQVKFSSVLPVGDRSRQERNRLVE